MTITEFRRRCANRDRLVMVRDTDVWVRISVAQAESLFKRLDGHVTVHVEDDVGYAWIEASPEGRSNPP